MLLVGSVAGRVALGVRAGAACAGNHHRSLWQAYPTYPPGDQPAQRLNLRVGHQVLSGHSRVWLPGLLADEGEGSSSERSRWIHDWVLARASFGQGSPSWGGRHGSAWSLINPLPVRRSKRLSCYPNFRVRIRSLMFAKRNWMHLSLRRKGRVKDEVPSGLTMFLDGNLK